jgi:uncharacterized iron-regulated membrane protein
MIVVVTVSVYASPPASTRHLSNAMFAFMLVVLMGFLSSYIVWVFREQKRRKNPPKVVNRGPVRRPLVAYRKKRISEI